MNSTHSKNKMYTTPAVAEPTTSSFTAQEAIQRAQNGDNAAFEYLYRSHSRHVYSVCLGILKNTADAEDMTQQVFLQLFRKIGTFRGESGFSTWLHRVTVNVVLMQLRRKKPTEILVEDLDRTGVDSESRPEHNVRDTSMMSLVDRLNLRRAVRELPSGYKRHFLLYDLLGYEHKEIARYLGCSTGSSKSRLHKARRRLRRLLKGERCASREVDVAAT
jgi:RNA polymerase sigma-70 factor (ECF subfamily)